MTQKILVIAPHADDEILGCGGTISKYSLFGYDVRVLILTDANKGAPELFSKKYIINVREEAKKANKIIGTKKLYFEDLPALKLNQYPFYKISKTIENYIEKLKPEVILLPSGNDLHDDHKITFRATKVASRINKKSSLKKILSYEVLSETEWNENEKSFNPNYFVSLGGININSKIQAFLKYKSQNRKFPHPRSTEGILNLSKVRGSQVFMEHAEAFKVEKIID